LIFHARGDNLADVKSKVCLFLCLLLACGPATPAWSEDKPEAKKRYILYATFHSDTPVELSDGARWLMDRGDSFPVLMFKEQQTKIVLQFAGAQFITETSRVKIIPGEQVTPEMIANYRHNVEGYVESKSGKLLQQLQLPKAEKGKAEKKKAAVGG